MTYQDRLKELGLEPKPERIWVARYSRTAQVELPSEAALNLKPRSWEWWKPFEGNVSVLSEEW